MRSKKLVKVVLSFVARCLHLAFNITLKALMVMAAFLAQGALALEKLSPQAELELDSGNELDRAYVKFMAPIVQNKNSALFADLRAQLYSDNQYLDELDNTKVSIGVVGRMQIRDDGILGGYLFGDFIRQSGTNYGQFMLGAEFLSPTWEVRANAYFPQVTNILSTGQSSYIDCGGGAVNTMKSNVTSASGFEVEGGIRAPGNGDVTVAIIGGIYGFEGTDSNYAAMDNSFFGYKTRAEFIREKQGDGVRAVAGIEMQYDSYHGSNFFGFVKIQLAYGQEKTLDNYHPLERRMTEFIIRDDINNYINKKTAVQSSLVDFLKDVGGTAYDSVILLQAGDDIPAAVSAAGANSLVILNGAYGVIDITNPVTLSPNQSVMGAQLFADLTGLQCPFSRPTVQNLTLGGTDADNSNFILNNSNTIEGIDIIVDSDTAAAIYGNAVNNTTLIDINITTAGDGIVLNGDVNTTTRLITVNGTVIVPSNIDSYSNDAPSRIGLVSSNSTNASHDNINISNMLQGILVTDSINGSISNATVNTDCDGITVSGGQGHIITNILVSGSGAGVVLDNTAMVNVDNVTGVAELGGPTLNTLVRVQNNTSGTVNNITGDRLPVVATIQDNNETLALTNVYSSYNSATLSFVSGTSGVNLVGDVSNITIDGVTLSGLDYAIRTIGGSLTNVVMRNFTADSLLHFIYSDALTGVTNLSLDNINLQELQDLFFTLVNGTPGISIQDLSISNSSLAGKADMTTPSMFYIQEDLSLNGINISGNNFSKMQYLMHISNTTSAQGDNITFDVPNHSNITISDNSISDIGNTLYINGTQDVNGLVLQGNDLSGISGNVVVIDGVSDKIINDLYLDANTVAVSGIAALELRNCANLVFNNSVIAGQQDIGLSIQDGSTGIDFQNLQVSALSTGIKIVDDAGALSGNNVLINNVLINGAVTALEVSNAVNITITNITPDSGNLGGITITDASNITIDDSALANVTYLDFLTLQNSSSISLDNLGVNSTAAVAVTLDAMTDITLNQFSITGTPGIGLLIENNSTGINLNDSMISATDINIYIINNSTDCTDSNVAINNVALSPANISIFITDTCNVTIDGISSINGDTLGAIYLFISTNISISNVGGITYSELPTYFNNIQDYGNNGVSFNNIMIQPQSPAPAYLIDINNSNNSSYIDVVAIDGFNILRAVSTAGLAISDLTTSGTGMGIILQDSSGFNIDGVSAEGLDQLFDVSENSSGNISNVITDGMSAIALIHNNTEAIIMQSFTIKDTTSIALPKTLFAFYGEVSHVKLADIVVEGANFGAVLGNDTGYSGSNEFSDIVLHSPNFDSVSAVAYFDGLYQLDGLKVINPTVTVRDSHAMFFGGMAGLSKAENILIEGGSIYGATDAIIFYGNASGHSVTIDNLYATASLLHADPSVAGMNLVDIFVTNNIFDGVVSPVFLEGPIDSITNVVVTDNAFSAIGLGHIVRVGTTNTNVAGVLIKNNIYGSSVYGLHAEDALNTEISGLQVYGTSGGIYARDSQLLTFDEPEIQATNIQIFLALNDTIRTDGNYNVSVLSPRIGASPQAIAVDGSKYILISDAAGDHVGSFVVQANGTNTSDFVTYYSNTASNPFAFSDAVIRANDSQFINLHIYVADQSVLPLCIAKGNNNRFMGTLIEGSLSSGQSIHSAVKINNEYNLIMDNLYVPLATQYGIYIENSAFASFYNPTMDYVGINIAYVSNSSDVALYDVVAFNQFVMGSQFATAFHVTGDSNRVTVYGANISSSSYLAHIENSSNVDMRNIEFQASRPGASGSAFVGLQGKNSDITFDTINILNYGNAGTIVSNVGAPGSTTALMIANIYAGDVAYFLKSSNSYGLSDITLVNITAISLNEMIYLDSSVAMQNLFIENFSATYMGSNVNRVGFIELTPGTPMINRMYLADSTICNYRSVVYDESRLNSTAANYNISGINLINTPTVYYFDGTPNSERQLSNVYIGGLNRSEVTAGPIMMIKGLKNSTLSSIVIYDSNLPSGQAAVEVANIGSGLVLDYFDIIGPGSSSNTYGIKLTRTRYQVTVSNSSFAGLNSGIWFADVVEGGSIDNNTFTNSARAMYVSGHGDDDDYINVRDNIFVDVDFDSNDLVNTGLIMRIDALDHIKIKFQNSDQNNVDIASAGGNPNKSMCSVASMSDVQGKVRYRMFDSSQHQCPTGSGA